MPRAARDPRGDPDDESGRRHGERRRVRLPDEHHRRAAPDHTRRPERGDRTGTRAEVGAPAPDFELLTLDRCTAERLSAHRGTPVVLTFFASWCHPCEEEMPLLEAAHHDDPNGFDVLAVTYKDLRGDAVQFTDRLGVTYPALFDTDGNGR